MLMVTAIISRDGDPSPRRETIPGQGTIIRSSIEKMNANRGYLESAASVDLVLLEGFDLHDLDATERCLGFLHIAEGTPFARIDRA